MKCSVILVSWNCVEFIGSCLDSLSNQNFPWDKFEVFLIDNGSSDESVEFVKQHYPWVRVLNNTENNYAGANNLGVEKSSGEFISFLNPDTKVDPDWLKELVETLDSNPKVGVVTSKIYENEPHLFAVGMRETDDLDWEPIGNGEKDNCQYDGVYTVKYINHCSCLYRRECLDKVGLLDTNFMMYHEDVDMSLRVRRAGWQLMVNTNSIVYHQVHGSIEKSKHMFNYYIDRNRLYVIAKHFPRQFAENFSTSRFYRYGYEDHSGDSLQRDLIVLFDYWLKERDSSSNLSSEFALILRKLKERSHDRLDQFETDLKLKSEGFLKAICQLEFDMEGVKQKLVEIKRKTEI